MDPPSPWQIFCVLLTQTSICPVGFKACAASAVAVAAALLCCARYPKLGG